MAGESVEQDICAVLTGSLRQQALEFAAHLRGLGMDFRPGSGYWAGQHYWMAWYRGEYACFLLIGGHGPEAAEAPLTVWTDDSGTDWFANVRLEPSFRETALAHVDYCGSCGGCGRPGGSRRKLFGQELEGVCITAMRFHAPAEKDWRCLHRLMELWKQAREE